MNMFMNIRHCAGDGLDPDTDPDPGQDPGPGPGPDCGAGVGPGLDPYLGPDPRSFRKPSWAKWGGVFKLFSCDTAHSIIRFLGG